MSILRRIILALALIAGITPAVAQVPPPVPALPDTERRTSYTINASTCACTVNFALYGDSTDYANWVEVWLNGVRANFNDATFGWTITSPTGSLGSIALPITNAVLTFTKAQTGVVQIVGARRPRRTSQFNENNGVPTRNFNVVLSDLTAQNREVWDKLNDVTGRVVMAPPGETLNVLIAANLRASTVLGFDALGQITTYSPASAVTSASNVTYLAPGIGGIARTVQSKLADIRNATDYGVVCDGVTDDSAAFGVAFAAAAGKTLMLPASSPKCVIKNQVVVTSSIAQVYNLGPHIIGQGREDGGTVFDNQVANNCMFLFQSGANGHFTSGVTFEDFKVTSTTSPVASCGIELYRAAYGKFSNVQFTGLTGRAIYIPASSGDADAAVQISLDRVRCDNCATGGGFALDFSAPSGGYFGSNLRVMNTTVSGSGLAGSTANPPTSGGMVFKGLIAQILNSGFTINNGPDLYIQGPDTSFNIDINGTDFENNISTVMPHIYVDAGIAGFTFWNNECLNNDSFRSQGCLWFNSATAQQGNIALGAGNFVRATTGNNPYVAFQASGANIALDTIQITAPVYWQIFDGTGQTRFSGFHFKGVSGQAQFSISALNTAQLIPTGTGDAMPMKLAGSEWVEFHVPVAGITKTGIGGLTANTTYNFYLFNSAATNSPYVGAIDPPSTTVPALDAEGYNVKTGDTTRSWIGSAKTDGSGNFQTTGNSAVSAYGGGLAIPPGTSGGIPAYIGPNTIASSPLIPFGRVVVGGGSGATPASIGDGTATTVLHGCAGCAATYGAVAIGTDVGGLGTGVAAALGINIGTAGAPVVNGGALGTPSSGTGTNLTGLNASNLASGTTGVSVGGTGLNTLAAGSLVCGAGTSPFGTVSTSGGTSSLALVSNGAAVCPTYQQISNAALVNSSVTIGSTVVALGSTVATFAGVTLTAPNLVGVTTSSNAAAGSVGEFVSSTVLAGAAVSLVASTAKDVTTVSLTAGDWDVCGNVAFQPAGTTTQSANLAWISTTANTLPTIPAGGAYSQFSVAVAAGLTVVLNTGCTRLSLATTTTVSLGSLANFAVSTETAYGFIGARRRR